MSVKKIIDVSQYNDNINWSKVDCDGVIIRIAYRGYTAGTIKQDIKFLTNIKGAIENGIPIGIYFMSQAINKNEAVEEANYVVDQIRNFHVTLPIFYDSELSGAKGNTGRADNLSKVQRTAIVIRFCNRIKELNYTPGVYASTSWFKSNLDVSQLLDYHIWIAQYASTCTATHRKDMWQYTSKGSMAGISGNLDISHCYTDFVNASSTVSNTIPSNTTTIESVNYTTGTYKLIADLKVRMGAGTNYNAKSYSQLTANAKLHATSAGVLKSGTKVTVSEIIENGSDTWGKIPSGYIALHYNNASYATKC